MSKKLKGSEKMLFTCEKSGKRSLADFENVEEALQATGGNHQNLVFRPWWILGQPPPLDFNRFQDLQTFRR